LLALLFPEQNHSLQIPMKTRNFGTKKDDDIFTGKIQEAKKP
jgi:hypothetical protein